MCASTSFISTAPLRAIFEECAFLILFLFCDSSMSMTDLNGHAEQKRLNIALKRKRSYGESHMADLELAVAPMHRLCKKAGADRVSEAAAKELAEALEEIGIKIAKEAIDFAMHAGRKTIKAEDIEIAAKKVMGK
jgi:histone H3/H4